MKILITGGAGFIGSALVKQALADGHKVINVDKLTYAANLQSLKTIKGHKNYVFEKADICDAIALQNLFSKYKPDALMNLAAESHVDRSIDAPHVFLDTNITGTFTLLQCARDYWNTLSGQPKASFRFLHVSTDEVYGDLANDAATFTEETAYNPSSPYSASKAASDHLVRAWARTYGLPTLITNCSNNYGPFQFPEKLIPLVILKALHGQNIPVYGTGENIRDWLYVEDHVNALLTVLQKGNTGETYNIGGNNERTNIDVVETICTLLGKTKPQTHENYDDLIRFVADRPGHDKRYAVDTKKIETELGWQPATQWNAGFETTMHWYINNEWWWRPLIDTGQFGGRLGLE